MERTEARRPDAGSVLNKVQALLESFAPDDEHLSLSEIARRSGLAKTTVHRLAHELLEWGVLERRGTEYGLGLRLFELGQRVPRQRILRDAARPYMQDLYQATRETIHLSIPDGREVLYLEKVFGHGQVAWPSRFAGRMPLHGPATGKVFLAFGPEALLEEVLAEPLERITPYTVSTPSALRAEVSRAREQGYVVEREQARVGFVSVAVPLYGATGTVIAALSVTAPLHRAKESEYVSLLEAAGRRFGLAGGAPGNASGGASGGASGNASGGASGGTRGGS
ncbi:IclR family transcriptional regulator [Streptomyces sp. ODS28]|uniref:IclR family transcriptional regulator n=1 Tax=Streptomyces sp. ODS28 TaxID=3136688 RepID=UPI0031E9E5BD